MLGGSTADRFEKRTILVVTQIAQIALALTMGFLVLTNQVQIWMVVVVAALLGVVNAFEMPAASALVPELVEPEQLGDAMAVDRSSFHTTRLIGPALAGFVIGRWGAAIAYFVNALSFVGLMVALRSLPKRPAGTVVEEEARTTGFKDGLRYIKGDAPTFAMMLMMGLMTLVPSPLLMVLMPLYARTHFHLGAGGMGMMMSVNAAGALLGSIWLLGIKPEDRVNRLGWLSLGVAIGLFLLGKLDAVVPAAVALFGMSLCMASTFGLVNTIIQQRTPGYLRGRVSATTGMIFFGCQPFSALLVSRFADVVGLPQAFMIAGPVYLIGAALVLGGPGRKSATPPASPEPAAG
jgi:MFS family permease